MHSERRRKQLLRATHSIEYTSLMSASIADIIRREVFASSQTSRSVAEFRRTLYMLHDYNTLVFKCTYHYPISTETKLLLRRYVELESYVLYKSKWTPEMEEQVQKRVFKTVMYFISGSYHATGQSIAADRKLIFDEALKIFIHFADVSIDRFPAKILRNILNTLGIVNTSNNSDSALYVNNPSLKRLKEYLRDSDYGSDDDSVGSSEEAGIRQSNFKIHNEKKLLEKPPGVKFELNASNRVASSSSHGSLSLPINNSSFIQNETSVVSSVNNLGVQSIPHNQQQVSFQIRSRFKSQERSGFPEICAMFQSSDFDCSEEKCDFDSKPIMDKANDDFECIPTDFAYILDKQSRNTSIDEFPYTPSKHQSNMIQLAQYRDDAITKVNELEPIVNLTEIPEFSISISEQKILTDESNIGNMTSSSAMNMHSEFSNHAIFSSDLIVDESAIQVKLHLKTVSAENRDDGSVTDNSINFNPVSLNQNNDSETIVTNVAVPSVDTYTGLSKSDMFSGYRVGAIQYTENIDGSISTKLTAPVHSNDNKSQVEEFDYSNKQIAQSHSDINNSYRNIINAHKPVKDSRIKEILPLKEKSEQYKLNSSETFPLETHNCIHLIGLSQNSIAEKILSDETQKIPNGNFNKLDDQLINLVDNEGNSCTISENSYENIASTSKVKARNTYNPVYEDAIIDETTATTITTQVYLEGHQAQKNNANVIISMIGDSSTITRLKNSHQHIVNDFALESQLASDKKEISIQENMNKNENNFSAAIEHTSNTNYGIESGILEVGKSEEKTSKYASSLSENKGIACDVHKIRINQKVQSVLEETVISGKILDNESFTCKLTSASHIASDGKIAKVPKMKSQTNSENINSSPVVRKINNFHPIKLNNYTGETEFVSKEQEEYSNWNNTIINVHKQLKSNFEVEKELVDDNSLCGLIGENETSSIINQPLVSNNTNDVSSTCEIILEDKFGKVCKASIDNKRSTEIIHDLDTYKTQQYNRTFNLNWNEEPSSVVSLNNLQQNIVNDFVVETGFVSTEKQINSQEGMREHQLPLRDEELNCTFQRDVNGLTPKISECISIYRSFQSSVEDSGNTRMVNKESPNVSQTEIIDVINNFSASFESNDDVNMQNKSEEQKTKSSCLPESNEYTSAENSSHSIPNLSGDILIINEGETINSISDQFLDSINTKDKRSLSSEEKSKDAFEDENTLSISDNSCTPNILHDSESDQTAFDLYVNTNTITTPVVTSEASNQHVNNDFDVKTPLDFDQHKVNPMQGNNIENQLLVSSKALPKSSINYQNTINLRSLEHKGNDSSCSGVLEAINKIDDYLSVEIENLSASTHETKVPLFDANKCYNISVQHANEYHQNIEHHISVCEKNQSLITENKRKFQSADEMLTRVSSVNEIEEVISSSEEALKIDLDKADSGIRVITECVDNDENITVNVNSTSETELPSLLIDHNSSSKKEEKVILDYVMQDPNAIETTFYGNISDGVNELGSIAKLKSISEIPTQESKDTVTKVTALNEESVLPSDVNEIEGVIDSSSQEAVRFDLKKLHSGEITEIVKVDSNITINSDSLFETESMDHDSSSKKEDKSMVDYVMQDPCMIETTFHHNVCSRMKELRSIEEQKPIPEFATSQESETVLTYVSCLNEKSDLITSGNEIEEVADLSSKKAVRFSLDISDLGLKEITECVDIDTNVVHSSLETELPSESIDHNLSTKKEDETIVDCEMQDPNVFENTFCHNVPDGLNELRPFAESKSVSEFPILSQESDTAKTSVPCLNQESDFITNIHKIEEVIDSSSQQEVNIDLDKPDSAGIKQITECVDINTNTTINVDTSFETDLPSESVDNNAPSKIEDKTIVDYVIQDKNVIETTFCENVSDRLNELRSFAELKSMSELSSVCQQSETVETYVSCHNEESGVITSGNGIEKLIDLSSQKAVKFDLDMPDLDIIEITECVNIDANVDCSSFETKLPSQSNDHDPFLKKEDKTIVDYVTKDSHVTETTFCDNVSDGTNELRSIAELKSKPEITISSQESETAITSLSCLNENDVISSINEIEEVIDSSSQKEMNIDLEKLDLSENKINECAAVIDTNVITDVNSAFDRDLPSELINPNSSSKKEDEITVDYAMQDSIVIESTVCENILDEMNELRSVAKTNSISKFPLPTQELETVITSVSCLNQESDVITSVNEIEEVGVLSSKKDLKIDWDKLDSGMKKITVDYEDPNVIETSFCEKVSDRLNEHKLIAELKSVSEFPNPTHELETPITIVTCRNQESTLLTDNTFSDDISSSNSLTIEKKHKNKQTSDILPTLPKEVNIEDSMLLTCETTSEDSFEKINKGAVIELGPGNHKSPPDLTIKVINHTDSNKITEFLPLQNTLGNNISFEDNTVLMKETEILIEDKVNQHISQIMPKGMLGNSIGSEIYEAVSAQKVKSLYEKKISSQSVTDFTAYSIQKKTNVTENNSDNITKPNTNNSEPNKSPELNKYVPTEKVTLPIYCEVVDVWPTDDNNKMITDYETSSHYTKVIAESSAVDVSGVPNVSTNHEQNAKTPDTYYAFQVNSLPDELKMLADVASNRKHMKVAKGKPNSKTEVILRNRSQKNCKRKTKSYNNKKTVSKPQKAKNSKINDTEIRTDRNKIIDGKMSSHITNEKEKFLSLVVGKTCIEKPQKSNNSTSQSCPVSIRRRIKTLGELKHFDFSSFEKSNRNKLTDQLRYSENDTEEKLESVETIDTMKDLSGEPDFSLDKQKLLANSIGVSETTKDVPINVLDDTLEKKNVSSEVKVDKHATVFSEEEEKNEYQTECLKHKEVLEKCKINRKIVRSDNEKSLLNNPKESVKVIVEEVFPMEYSGDIGKAIRTQTNPFEVSSFYTEFVPCRLGVYTSPTRTAEVPSTANNVNSTKDNFKEKTDTEYKCEESMDDLNNQRFDSYDKTFSGNNSEATDISNLAVAFTSTPIKGNTESYKNKSGCSEKRKCTFDDISSSSENNEKKLFENTSRKNKRKHSPKKIRLDNELNQKAKEINTFSTDGEKRDKPCSVEKLPSFVDDTISKPKEIRKSIEHIVTSLKSCNSGDISGCSSYVKLQQEVVDYNSDVKLSHGNVGYEEISILSNDEYNKIISHLPFNQNIQKHSNKCEATNHILEAETKETENFKISSHESCSNLCESVEISSIEKKEISSDETCPNLCDDVEAENAPCKHVYFPNSLLSNDNTVTEEQISMQDHNMDCVNDIETPIKLGVHSHLSEEHHFVDKISCHMLETLCAQKTGCTENSSNCMETLVETVTSNNGQNSNNVHIQDELESKLPVDDLSFLIDEANNSFERTNFVFSSASEVSRFLADTNTSQISETLEENSVMNHEEFDIRLVNSSFLETFVNGFPFCNDCDCIGSEVTVSSNILTDPLVGGQEEPISNKEELSIDDTDVPANNLGVEATSYNDYIFMYGDDQAQAISQMNSQKLLTEFQSDNKLPQINSQQSSFEDEKNDLKLSQINSQKGLRAVQNNDEIFKTNSPNCSTDNEKLTGTTCSSLHKISNNKLTENENSEKFMTNVSQVKVTSVNLRNDISLRSRKDSMLSKSSDSSVRFQSNNDTNKYEPKCKRKRKWSNSSQLTKDSIVNESSISNTKASVPKRKPSSETCNIQRKEIQETADSKINSLNIKVDNTGSSSRLNSLRSTSHTAAKEKETQKTQYDSMYDKVKSNQNRRAASKNINYSETNNDDHSSNKATKFKRIKTSNSSHGYTLHENSEESCSFQSLEDPLKSHDSSESFKSKSRSETMHSQLGFNSSDFSSSEYSTCQRTERATCQRTERATCQRTERATCQRSQRTSKSDNFQTTSQLSSSNHRLSRSRSDIRTDQYKEKHKDSSISQTERKLRFNEDRSYKWRKSSNDRMSLEENKKRELFSKIPFRVGKQGPSSESDYEKDHKWRKKFSKLYPYTTTANMFSKQTAYDT